MYVQLFEWLGMATGAVSGLMKFEGPDPAFWCAHGYAVCNPDTPGSFNSEGDIRVWSRREGQECHDLIEWLGVQEWCNGKVGTSGNSYLAISQRIASAEKWLRIHNTMEWPDYYEEANVNDLLRFFDHFLKGIDNGWEETPRVRYSVLDLEGNDRINQPAGEFPPEDVDEVKYYLDAAAHALTTEAPAARATASYDAESEDGRAPFNVRVDFAPDIVD